MHVRGGDRGLFVSAAALSIGLTYANDTGGNWIIFVVGALAIMLYSLEKGCDVMAGVFWAVVAIKPQDGFLLAIPLLLAKKWKTIFVAGGICLAFTCIASALIGKSIMDLLLEVPKLRSGDIDPIHISAKMIPASICQGLFEMGISVTLMQYASMCMGVFLCVIFSWMVRKSDNWQIRLLPALAFATVWTYMEPLDRSILFVGQIYFANRFLDAENSRDRTLWGIMLVVTFLMGIWLLVVCTNIIAQFGSCIGVPTLGNILDGFLTPFDYVVHWIFMLGVALVCILEWRRVRRNG